MRTGLAGAIDRAVREVTKKAPTSRCIVVGSVLAALILAGHEAGHVVLVLLATLGMCTAGVGFLLRWRVTSTAATRQIGVGLLLLGLHRPVAVATSAALGHQWPRLSTAVGLGVVLVAAGVTLRALPCRCLPPVWRLSRRAAALAAVAVVGLVALAATPAVPALGIPALLAGAGWSAVAVAAWRSEPLAACERAPSRALAVIALLVAGSTTLGAVPQVWAASGDIVRVLVDLGLMAAAALACLTALRRLTAALDGQERYVAGLLEQLAGHEQQLQQARTCLHDARAAVASVRAASSAIRHLGVDQAATRADLEQSVAVELARLERLLRLPERTPSPRPVDLDQVVRAMVVSHRERGMRISWGPTGADAVVVDGDALAVILGNLLGNALVHAPRALCSVTVEVTDRLTVTVADDGPGLSPSGRTAAFEAGARRPGSPGEGLGLAISRDLARRHGGDLVAADSVAGARFVLTLPVRPAPRPTALSRPGPAAVGVLGRIR